MQYEKGVLANLPRIGSFTMTLVVVAGTQWVMKVGREITDFSANGK